MTASNTTAPALAITGAGGFIGSHLTELALAAGYAVRALVHYNAAGTLGHLQEVIDSAGCREGGGLANERLQIIHGDLLDSHGLRELVRGCDAVFHLAALIGIPYSYRSPSSYFEVNTRGTLNLLEACREEKPGRVIVTSTSEVYGTAQRVPINEQHPLQAQSPYSASKIAADKFAESYYLSFGLPVVTLRPFNTFGPRQSSRAIVPTILSQALSPDCPEIKLGSLDPVRDLTYVEDTASGFLALAAAPAERVVGRVFNLGAGHGRTIGEIAKAALLVAGVTKPIRTVEERLRPEKSEVQRLIADAGAISTASGWKPQVGFDEGLHRTADWIRKHPGAFRPAEYRV